MVVLVVPVTATRHLVLVVPVVLVVMAMVHLLPALVALCGSAAADGGMKANPRHANSIATRVLILSTLAGAARELTNALQINPYDRRGVAQAIDAALSMPLSERRRRYEALIDTVRRNDIHAWHRTFMEELESSTGQSVLDVPEGAVGGGRP